MKRPSFRTSLAGATSIGALAALVACGGISDPTKTGNEPVAKVTGALTGTDVPSGTRVALVWRVGSTGTYAVGSDVAVVGGKFTMDLSTPSNGYFFTPAESDYGKLKGGGSASGTPTEPGDPIDPDPTEVKPPSAGGTPTPPGGGKSFAFANRLSPRDAVSGQINQPLSVALAGFVVYVDTNGNGKLDIEGRWAKATDTVIGGNDELTLAYFRDGGALDYEKLRDGSGILPHAGYNLVWEKGRWLPLDVVELKISNSTSLPPNVCAGGSNRETPQGLPPSTGSGSSEPPGEYPPSNDPNLSCSNDGYSFSYHGESNCTPSQPAGEGLCIGNVQAQAQCADDEARYQPSGSIEPGTTPPPGWPCPVTQNPPIDGGAAPDSGQ
jgi:hypothetical protein